MKLPLRFGPFELLDRISAGGMAEVFRARDTRNSAGTPNEIVAVKRILPHVAEDEQFVTMFEDEARIASKLAHPYIARMLDFGRSGGDYYISFEFVNGRDLRAVFERLRKSNERFPLPVFLYVFRRLAEGLSHAHSRMNPQSGRPELIVHRDVSPQNVIVSIAGDVKLIDFGIAKAAGKISSTQVGTIKGKFGYMSPEQTRGFEVDERTDVFSAGICMWELLTGERLFTGENELVIVQKIRGRKTDAPSCFRAEIGAELDRIVLRSLEQDVRDRYSSAKELYHDLTSLPTNDYPVATREEVAQTMQRLFPEVVVAPGTRLESDGAMPTTVFRKEAFDFASDRKQKVSDDVEENRAMTEKEGSDLDIFEGLGKKAAPVSPKGSVPPPPPPPSMRTPSAPPAPPVASSGKIAAALQSPVSRPSSVPPPLPPHVAAQASQSSPPESGRIRSTDSGSMRVTPSSSALKADSAKVPSQPPSSASGETQTSKISVRPPPSAPNPPRSTPAPALPPPSGANASAPAPTESAPTASVSAPELISSPELSAAGAPPPASTKPGAGDAEKTLQMEWDDDDEATHILDKTSEDVRPLPKEAVPPPSTSAPSGPPATPSYSKLQAVKPPPPPSPPAASGTIPPGSQLPPAAAAALVALPSASTSAPPPPNTMPGGFGDGVTGPAKSLVSAVNAPPPPPPPAAMHQPIGASQPPPPPPGARPAASIPPYSANAGPAGVSAPAATVPTGSIPPRPVQPDQVHTEPLSLPERLPQAPSRTEATQLVRSPRRSQLPYVIAGAAALLLGATVWWSIPKTGKLLVNVVNEKGNNVDRVEVLVDGNQKCVDSPCKVVDLTADTHQVKARLGSNSVVQEVRIEAGEEKKISVTLNGAAAATTTPVAPTKTGVKVANAQPGVHLYVDGKDLGAIGGPKEFILGAGDHKIKLDAPEKAGRYEALEKNVAVVDGNLFDLSSLQLRVLKGEVTLVNKTQGAKIMFVSGTERRVVPDDPKKTFPKTYGPLTIDAKDGKSWTIEATKTGYQDFSQVLSFADGNPEKTIEIDLVSKTQDKLAATEKSGGTKTTKTTATSTPPAGTETPGGDEKPDTTPKPKATATETAPKGDAKLTMNSLPSSNIILDGKSIGTTPKVGYPVSAGEHTITFNNAEQSLKKTTQVNVAAGDTKVVVMKLRD